MMTMQYWYYIPVSQFLTSSASGRSHPDSVMLELEPVHDYRDGEPTPYSACLQGSKSPGAAMWVLQ